MTQDELKALIADLRLNHEFCPKEVILQAADELERLLAKTAAPPQRTWVGLFDEEIWQIATGCTIGGDLHADKFARAIESKLKEVNT